MGDKDSYLARTKAMLLSSMLEPKQPLHKYSTSTCSFQSSQKTSNDRHLARQPSLLSKEVPKFLRQFKNSPHLQLARISTIVTARGLARSSHKGTEITREMAKGLNRDLGCCESRSGSCDQDLRKSESLCSLCFCGNRNLQQWNFSGHKDTEITREAVKGLNRDIGCCESRSGSCDQDLRKSESLCSLCFCGNWNLS